MGRYKIRYVGIIYEFRGDFDTIEEAKKQAERHLHMNANTVRIIDCETGEDVCIREWYGYGDMDMRKVKDPIEVYPYGFYGDWVEPKSIREAAASDEASD